MKLDTQKRIGRPSTKQTTQAPEGAAWAKWWRSAHTPWRRRTANAAIRRALPKLKAYGLPKGAQILVPLCGDSPALKFFHLRGHSVSGVEFVPLALKCLRQEQFSSEVFSRKKTASGILFSAPRLNLFQGDFYRFSERRRYDLVYDRGALVAIEPKNRKKYSRVVDRSLKPGALLFLVAFDRSKDRKIGPPYPLSLKEIRALFAGYRLRFLEQKEKLLPGQASHNQIIVVLQKPRTR